MSNETIGIILALIASFGFAIWSLPRKYTLESSNIKYITYYSIGLILSGILLGLLFGFKNIDLNENFLHILIGLSSGIILGLGIIIFNISIEKNGFAITNAFKNTQPLAGYLFGGFILGEFYTSNPYLVFTGTLLISIVGVFIYMSSINEFKKSLKFVIIPVISGIIFSFGIMLQKVIMDLGFPLIILLNGIGIFIVFNLISFFKKERLGINNKGKILGIFSGILASITYVFIIQAYKYLDFSIVYAITNISTLWVILISIFVLKELEFKKYKKIIFLGIFILIIAIILLYLSKVFV